MTAKKAVLVLEDGSRFEGKAFGSGKSAAGEVVFNTGMVGYPESFTDPSYAGQILALTYPLIGNYGVPPQTRANGFSKYFESERIQIAGLVVSGYSRDCSHWNATECLDDWLRRENIPAMAGIDTRALTQKLREKGVMLGKIVAGRDNVKLTDPNKRNLVAEVSCREPVVYGEGVAVDGNKPSGKAKKTVALLDCGVKNNIIRSFLQRGVRVVRLPWNYNLFDSEYAFDGLFISNGPGDPKKCMATLELIRAALEKKMPTFGICLGNQLLALAVGADTYKLKYGHRSQNQPCKLEGTRRCFITAQNHGFAVDETTLPRDWKPWFTNLNDGTNEGIRHKSGKFFSVQFHPEATPGPLDCGFLFDEFIKGLKK